MSKLSRILEALTARLVLWLTPEPVVPPIIHVAAPEPPLKPGLCECDHERCCHERGVGECFAAIPPSEEWPRGGTCACQIFIPDDDDDDDEQAPTPSPEDLERMFQ